MNDDEDLEDQIERAALRRDSTQAEAMRGRHHYVGETMVCTDEHGPYSFWRHGKEVQCVCDSQTGMVCRYHSRQSRKAD